MKHLKRIEDDAMERAVIITNITGGATKFWIKPDRLLDEKSNDLFMYKFIFSNKNDANWKKSC